MRRFPRCPESHTECRLHLLALLASHELLGVVNESFHDCSIRSLGSRWEMAAMLLPYGILVYLISVHVRQQHVHDAWCVYAVGRWHDVRILVSRDYRANPVPAILLSSHS